MSAKVIQLREYLTAFVSPTGVVFPEPYRLTGYYWEEVQGGLDASSRAAPTEIVLGDRDDAGLANPSWKRLSKLDPSEDRSGWVIVRHQSESNLEGYFDALSDMTAMRTVRLYATENGLFTMLRMPPPLNCPDHLLIYVWKHDEGDVGPEDRWRIVHPDGSITYDIDAVTPHIDE